MGLLCFGKIGRSSVMGHSIESYIFYQNYFNYILCLFIYLVFIYCHPT